jgi:hypothetical protein
VAVSSVPSVVPPQAGRTTAGNNKTLSLLEVESVAQKAEVLLEVMKLWLVAAGGLWKKRHFWCLKTSGVWRLMLFWRR